MATTALVGVAGLAAPGGDTLDSIRPKKKAPARVAPRKPAVKKSSPARRSTPVAKARPTKKPATPMAVRSTAEPIPVPVTARLPGDSLANGRVAWWPMEGNAKDIVGGNDGAFRRGVSAVPGMVGVGLQFDGNGSGIVVRDAPALQFTDSFSISMWVMVQAFPGPGGQSQIFFRGDGRGGLDPYSLYLSPGGKIGVTADSGTETLRMETPLPERTPIHVSAVLDARQQVARIYLNGKVAAEAKTRVRPFRDLVASAHAGIGIGNTQYPGEYEQAFHGILDDLQVHNRTLTPDEVATLARR